MKFNKEKIKQQILLEGKPRLKYTHEQVKQAIRDVLAYSGLSNNTGLAALLEEISVVESGYKKSSGSVFHVGNPFQLTSIAIKEIKEPRQYGYKKVRPYIFKFQRNAIKAGRFKQYWWKQSASEIQRLLLLNVAGALFYLIYRGALRSTSSMNSRANFWKTRYNTNLGAGTPNYYQNKVRKFLGTK